MKKTSLIIIGFVLTVFLSGHFFIFKISQRAHHSQFRAFFQQNLAQLKKIDILPSELFTDSKRIKWLDNNQEIMIDDIVYDIVFKKNAGESVSLFVIKDIKEKALIDKYNQLANSIFNDSNPGKPDVVKDFLSLKYLQYNPFELNASNTFSSKLMVICTVSLSNGFLTQETPPPNKIS